MATRIRAFDWSTTPLGPIADWPQSLKTTVDNMLGSGQAMMLAWGPQNTILYNDAYAPMMGDWHPTGFARPLRDAWPDVWDNIAPLVDQVFRGQTVRFENMPLITTRHGNPEQSWWTFSYSPVRNEADEIAGLLNVPIDTTAQVRAEAALRESEAQYRLLFDATDDGFCVLEVLFDENDRPFDYIFLKVNPAFERQTGLHDPIGRTMLSMAPQHEPFWIETYGRIVRTGRSERFESPANALGRWYEVDATPIGDLGENQVAVVFRDVRQAFLLKLSDALRPLADPGEIQRTAVRLLAEHLDVMRAFIFEVDDDDDGFQLTARHERNSPPPVPDRMRLSDFGPEIPAAYRAGQTVVFRDTETETHLGSRPEMYRPFGLRAWIAAPLVEDGRLVAVVGVNAQGARD